MKKTITKRIKDVFTAAKKGNVGDAIKEVTDSLGIEQCKECKDRQRKWNFGDRKIIEARFQEITHGQHKGLEDEEFKILDDYFEDARELTGENQRALLKIYNRVFTQYVRPTSCYSCWKKYEEYLELLWKLNI